MTDPARRPVRNALGQPVGWPVEAARFPRPRPRRAAIAGTRVVLEPAEPAHADALHAAFAEDRAGRGWTYLPYGPFPDAAAHRAWLTAAAARDDPLFFAVVEVATGRPGGLLAFLRIAPETGVVEIGHIHFAPALAGSAAATEALALAMGHAMDDLGYRRLEWKCDALNAASRRAAERLGFVFEGVFRQAAHYKGRNRDTAWYALTDADWPPLRAALSAWCAPGNFDADGRQIARLRDFRHAR